ncbi:MAG: nucleotide sugar dehydrogenase [Pseudonocardia sp.]|nr:nucleotide sugar dehydrogenase [Pseudonocardia sp.]
MRAVDAGFDVLGFDLAKDRVDRLRRGESFIDDVTDSNLGAALATGRFHATDDAAELAGFDFAVVTVPTPLLDGIPDLSYIEQAALALAPHVSRGCCVVLESTTYPGTTEDIFIPLLESASPLRAGRDFHVGYSPERIDPSNTRWGFRNTPKIVAGVDSASLNAVSALYDMLVDEIVPVPHIREAEMAKLLENTFRHVNIALVNELAMYCKGLDIDVWSVIDAASSKPFGFMKFTPGPGVGGHCLPIDPTYLSWQVRRTLGQNFRFVEIANDINDHMPDYVVRRAVLNLNSRGMAVNGSKILLVGLAYKANSGDARKSPAVIVANQLAALGGRVTAIDPLIPPEHAPSCVEIVAGTDEQIAGADLVVVLTDHDDVNWAAIRHHADRVLDTRNRLRGVPVDRL